MLTQAQAEQLATAYAAASPPEQQPDRKRDAVAAAAAWLATQIDLAALLAPLMPGMAADGYMIGAASEVAVLTSGGDAAVAGWRPGDTGAATARVNELGAGDGLEDATASADPGAMAHGWYVTLGRALVEGAVAGLAAKAIGRTLLDALADTAHATSAALNWLLDCIGRAARDIICGWPGNPQNPEAPPEEPPEDQGPGQPEPPKQPPKLPPPMLAMQWITTPGACPVCLDNEAEGPLPAGEAWPDGSDMPPAHPHCRCYIVGVPSESGSADYRRRE